MPRAAELSLANNYADRQLALESSGSVAGSNVGATVESGEPRHDGKRGGHSVWISWVAPTNGIATFSTSGSSFDTLLAVYAQTGELEEHESSEPSNKERFEGLKSVADSDDDFDASRETSYVQFGARKGVRYEIAVDGFSGAVGQIQLSWTLMTSGQLLPNVLQIGPDRAVREGDTVTLTTTVPFAGEAEYRWYFNDRPIDDAERPNLLIRPFTSKNVGVYKLRVKVGELSFFSSPVEVQINTEGEADTLARDKMADSVESSLAVGPAAPNSNRFAQLLSLPIGVMRGFSGSQLFDTTFARRDPGEPLHCGLAGGASYWFAYTAPADGMLVLDTLGSDYDTVLAVYTYAPPLLGYDGLQSVACNNDSSPNNLTSRLDFQAKGGQVYLVAIDGVNGAHGHAHLNYQLTDSLAGTAPTIVDFPVSPKAIQGQAVTLAVRAMGVGPLRYQWRFNDADLPGQTNSTLTIAHVALSDSGTYQVVVSAASGQTVNRSATLIVETPLVPPTILVSPLDQTVDEGQNVTFTASSSGSTPLSYQWMFNGAALTGESGNTLNLTAVTVAQAGDYVVVVSNAVGSATSRGATLSVSPRMTLPQIELGPSSQIVSVGESVSFASSVIGSGPFHYQWLKDGVMLETAVSPTLEIPAVDLNDAGEYVLAVWNALGGILSVPALLRVIPTPRLELTQVGANPTLSFNTALNLRYRVDVAESVQPLVWSLFGFYEGTGGRVIVDTLSASQSRFFRLQVE